jgi:hypothetical protein
VQKSLLANKVLVVVVLKGGRGLKVQRCQVVVTCTWGARAAWLLLGGYPKSSDDCPNTRESSKYVQLQSWSAKRLWFPLQAAQVPKSLNPFTRALAPPFIGIRRDFYIPITPLASENIPSVNAYRIVFFI